MNIEIIGLAVSIGILMVGLIGFLHKWRTTRRKEAERAADLARRAAPRFVGSGGSYHRDAGTFRVRNVGGDISNIKIESIDEIPISFKPTSILRSNDELTIDVKVMPQPLPEKMSFKLVFTDIRGELGQATWSYLFEDRVWIEEP